MFTSGAGEGTRTPTPKAPDPKSGASANFATPAFPTCCLNCCGVFRFNGYELSNRSENFSVLFAVFKNCFYTC